MTWTTPNDIKAQLAKLWDHGDLLRDAVSGETIFPLRLKLKAPGPADITQRFDAVRNWAQALRAATAVRIAWHEVRHRVQGLQSLPGEVWIDTVEDALAWLGRRRDRERFEAQVAVTRELCPQILPWLQRRPLQALGLAEAWGRLLDVVVWFRDHPRPGIYLRQIDIPGVHSKFIERFQGVLGELLPLVLADDVPSKSFATRFGCLEKPVRVRFRLLDPDTVALAGTTCPDITLNQVSFNRLSLDVRHVFITENETNFLAFPAVAHAMVIFGGGYGWTSWGDARWLDRCGIHYWGDIDTHGFAILDSLRSHVPHVVSFLMDRETLEAHRTLWGMEDKPQRADLTRLTPDEQALYDDLRDNRIQPGLRLEQEHIGFGWVEARLRNTMAGSSLMPTSSL